MDIPYEKMSPETSSVLLVDGVTPVQEAPVRIRHYFVFSLFSAICLCPATGLIALAYSLKSSAKADVKFHDKARLYSRRALLWNLISVIFVVFTLVMMIIFCYYFEEMIKTLGSTTDYQYQKPQATEISNEINRMIQSLTNEK